jgi:hypothetical protein
MIALPYNSGNFYSAPKVCCLIWINLIDLLGHFSHDAGHGAGVTISARKVVQERNIAATFERSDEKPPTRAQSAIRLTMLSTVPLPDPTRPP